MTIVRLIAFIIGMNVAVAFDSPIIRGLGIGLAAAAVLL